MKYEEKWAGRELSPDKLKRLSSFTVAMTKIRTSSPALSNYNQFLITSALASADIVGFDPDISTLIAYTKLSSSSMYKALKNMEDQNLIEYYFIPNDNKRKYVRSTKLLIDQYLDYLNQTNFLIEIITDRQEN
ncbi:MAG: hypothetical protein COB93_06305 [Sneathiella sp.]|nr:MAG: hypothetical protein COB93_06305 [Sneathiella sp.]